MSKIKLALEVVDALKQLTDRLETLVKEMQRNDKVKAPLNIVLDLPKDEPSVSIEAIRAVLAMKSQEGKTNQIKILLNKYDAGRLSSVDQKDYAAILKEAEEL